MRYHHLSVDELFDELPILWRSILGNDVSEAAGILDLLLSGEHRRGETVHDELVEHGRDEVLDLSQRLLLLVRRLVHVLLSAVQHRERKHQLVADALLVTRTPKHWHCHLNLRGIQAHIFA